MNDATSKSEPINKFCNCNAFQLPQLLFNSKPNAKRPFAIECPYCGKSTNWFKTENNAAKAWNSGRIKRA